MERGATSEEAIVGLRPCQSQAALPEATKVRRVVVWVSMSVALTSHGYIVPIRLAVK